MNITNISTYVFVLLVSAATTAAYSQQREIKESLVFSDPTVAKSDSWVKGFSVDYNSTTKDGVGYDSGGGAHYQSTNSNTVGFSGFIGYGNFTLMFTQAPERFTTVVPASGNLTTSTTINGSSTTRELVGRYLLTELQSTYFVPYVLGGYVTFEDTQDMDVYINGVREVNKNSASGPGLGLGGIFPISEKFGFRADAKQYYANLTTTSNVIAAFNASRDIKYVRSTITAYYNLTDRINLQLGVQSSFIVNQERTLGTGTYLKFGYTF
jgi:hypothetical protein